MENLKIPAIPELLTELFNTLQTKKWLISEPDVETINNYTRFYFDGLDLDAPILTWTTTLNGYGADIAYVEKDDSIQFLYDDIDGFRICFNEKLEHCTLESLIKATELAQDLGYSINHNINKVQPVDILDTLVYN